MDITNLLIQAGFTPTDILLLYYGPLAGLIGGVAHACYLDFEWTKVPSIEYTKEDKKEQKKLQPSWHSTNFRGGWMMTRLLLSGILGLAVSLFFLGSIAQTAPALSKIFLLCIAAGFGAPKLLGHLNNQIIERFESIIKNPQEK